MYAFINFAFKSLCGGGSIVPQTRGFHTLRWDPCPTNKEVSYTNLVSSLVVTLKLDNNNNNNSFFIINSMEEFIYIKLYFRFNFISIEFCFKFKKKKSCTIIGLKRHYY